MIVWVCLAKNYNGCKNLTQILFNAPFSDDILNFLVLCTYFNRYLHNPNYKVVFDFKKCLEIFLLQKVQEKNNPIKYICQVK